MKVRWHLPDRPAIEEAVADVEQLLFLLRLVRQVRIEGRTYDWDRSELVVDGPDWSVEVVLK